MSKDAPPAGPSEATASTSADPIDPIDPAGATLPVPAAAAAPAQGAPPELEPGARLGRYEITGRLGEGSMGLVFEARDTELDRTVALKLVRPGDDDVADAQTSLRREAQAMARLSHPNVAAVFDIGTVGDRLFIAMELVRGGTLRDLVGRRRPWRDQLRTLIAAGRGLAAAHEAGVIHRDFKPDNVLVRADGTVRVADFGLARAPASPRPVDLAGAAPTQTHGIAGTLAYMAPESFEGTADAATDQFAFAVTAFELLEGHRPFERGALEDVWSRRRRAEPRRPWERRELPARVRAAIDRALAPDPAARWPSMAALCDALAPRRRARARAWAVALVVAVAAAAAGIAAIASRAPDPASARPPGAATAPTFNEGARQQLTFSGDASLPRLSPDGRWLAYAVGHQQRSIAVQDLTTGRGRIVYGDAAVHHLRWSHDSAQLVIGGGEGAVVIDRAGARRTHVSGCTLAAAAPDGARVVTACPSPGKGLKVVELATGKRQQVPLPLDVTWVRGLDWSRLDRVAVLTQGRAGHQLWTMRPDGTELREAASDATSASLSLTGWGAGGEAIFYERVRDQFAELVRLEIDPRSGTSGRAAVLLTAPVSDGDFSIAGDGRALVYARRERSTNLAQWSVDGAPRALTVDTRDKRALAISRDRRRIAYAAGAGQRKQIFIASPDGTNATPIPNVMADLLDLDWSPDGTQLAYSARSASAVELWTVDVATGATRKLTPSAAAEHGDLVWASPGTLLYSPTGNRGYRVLELATGRERELVADRLTGWMFEAERSPDLRRIAVHVSASSTAMSGLWSISLEDGDARRLYLEPLFPSGWSEDGAWVYAQDEAMSMTYAIAASGSGEIRPLLAAPRPTEEKIRIAADERTALALEVTSRSDVWRISVDGAPPPIAATPPEPPPEPRALASPTNGDLSRGVAGQAPDGWSPGPRGRAALTESCLGASDRCAAVSDGAWLDQRVDARAYRGQRIRVRARTHAAGGRRSLQLWLHTSAGLRPPPKFLAMAPTDAAGWQALELVADVRPDAQHLVIRIVAAEQASALFDDVSLEIVER